MQNLPTPTKEAEASLPTKNVREDPKEILKLTFKIPCKAAQRTHPWELKAGKLNHLSPPQDQYTQARKKPRLEEPFPVSTGEATAKISSLDTTVSLPSPDGDDDHHADSDPVMDMHLNASATGVRRRWTKDEDTRLKKAVLVQTHDGETKNWDAIAALVPVEQKVSVKAGGMMPWIPVMSRRLRVWINGHQMKMTS
jgi:hypothetical protein